MLSAHAPAAVRTGQLVPALLGVWGGIAGQLQQPTLLSWGIYAGCLLSGLVLGWVGWKSRRPWGHGAWLAALMGAVLAFGLTGLRASAFQAGALDPVLEGRDLAVTGLVVGLPQRNESGWRFGFEVESARWQDQAVSLPKRVELSWYEGPFSARSDEAGTRAATASLPAVEAGERWQFTVRLKAPHGNRNPHGFDYELWLWEQGIQASGYVRTSAQDPPPQRTAQTGAQVLARARQRIRDQIFEQVTEPRHAGVVAALVTGDQNAIERADWELFRATGVAHLMSISGLHITMFAWLATLLVGGAWRRSSRLCLLVAAPSAALIGGVALASAYALFSGWGIPSQRTVWMLVAVGLLRLSGKRWPWPCLWLLVCDGVLLIDPWALLQPGFWLSFVAVGILFATGPASAGTASGGWRERLRALLHEQWVMTVALAPLTLLLFGQLSLVGLVANALAIPWVTLLITPLALLGVLAAPLWQAAALAYAGLDGYLQLLAAWPLATMSVAQAPLWAGAVGVLGGLLLVMPFPLPLRGLGLTLMLPVLLWQAPAPPPGQFELLAADIGQGNAVLVRTTGHALLYDAGPRFSSESDAGHRVIVPLLRALDVRLDLLVLSHRDSDHVGGAAAVLAMQPAAALLSSIEAGHALQAVRPARRCEAGQHWRWDGVDFEVLQPPADAYERARKSNALSCTLRVSNGAQSALLAGDIEQAQEALLLSAAPGVDLRADVLLVPHHGSKTSSSAAFLDAVQPRFALVQAGYRNRFGHPAEAVLARYAERQIAVFDSTHCGAASWRSAQPQAIACERTQQPRYWQHRAP